MNEPISIFDLTRQELATALDGEPDFRADQVFDWLYGKRVHNPAKMTNLSKDLRRRLSEDFSFWLPDVAEKKVASDETEKYRLLLKDGKSLECVMMPDLSKEPGRRGVSMCISSQVGCALKCDFCATGTMGLVRNLTPGEIVGQVVVMLREMTCEPTRVNIIYMGMGEPLHNTTHVLTSLELLNDEHGLNIPMRRITVSTAGIPKGMRAIFDLESPPRLALSLHAPTQELRKQLMPVSNKFTLEEIVNLCRELPFTMRDYLTFEYILLSGVNDHPQHAAELARLIGGIHAKVNLIPHNAWDGVPYEEPSEAAIDAFIGKLTELGVTATVRRSRGRDADAACGQLAVKDQRKARV